MMTAQANLRLTVTASQFNEVTRGLAIPGRSDIVFTLGAAQPVAPSPFLVNREVTENP